MPANKTRNSLARQWELLKLLPSRSEGKSAAELVKELNEAGYAISKRQVERDLLDLQEFFGLECNDDHMPYKWRWSFDRPSDLPAITLAEALSLVVVEETLKPLLPLSVQKTLYPKFLQAHSQLALMAKKSATARWAKKVKTVPAHLPLLPPLINEQILEEVQTALLFDEQITATYQGVSEKVLELRLHPLGLVTRGSVVYLVATANDYSDIRLYALHRFKKAIRNFEKLKPLKGFSLDRYVEEGALQFGEGAQLQLVALVSEDLSRLLIETPISKNQAVKAKGGEWILEATVLDTWQLRWWILSQGVRMRVLKPAALVKEIASTLRSAADQYSDIKK
ncbi:WYL domain-containing protein [Polynucleobacter paneuropaeus]|nr:WYL domain-containing protein [Polynucleobacter paneuropaeus]MBT8616009.1 WYL domain-containing protein [Polynucleobacter paneuropaeus]MBT8617890.1 WYL domain-containing protein [Polynucleobacter paneuropaeus]MBT8619771.1 WYL domain-containing protein [Polynucleobacter paneuropaeus]MBT8625306.1 WYL domain-containing protein [Polynucleobacter paneuropaeus]